MSGIAGIYCLDGSEADRHLLHRMMEVIAHRGPDDEGSFFSSNIGLGHKRLSIIDLTEAGHQPMVSEDGLLTIVHDGQVYNSPEIRQELERSGYRFHSNTDTEVILYSYRKWGIDCLKRFNGMWAFAIWDEQNRELFCARDRFGVKPFYYYCNGKVFVFASEIKAILEYPGIPKRINEEAVYNYLMWGLSNYSEGTFFMDIKALNPAHYLLINAKDGLVSRRWWSLEVNHDLGSLSENDVNDAVEHFRALLEEAVRLRLRSDVPVGTSLSGGLDSSSITMLVNRLTPDKGTGDRQFIGDIQKTFSSCYENKRIDERLFLKKVLQATGAEGNYVFPDGDNLWAELPRLIWHHDEPTGRSGTYARWSVMKKAKECGVKVLLNGDGGDELLAGYRHRYYIPFLLELALKGRVLTFLSETKNVSAILGIRNLISVARWILGIALYTKMPAPLQLRTRNLFQRLGGGSADKVLMSSFDKRFSHQGLARFSKEYSKSITNLNQRLGSDIPALTRDLWDTDRNSAAFSLETRTPFLDYRLVEYLFSLPSSLKIRHGRTKWILRQAMQGILPDEVRLRKDKLGFPTPTRAWLWSNREGIKGLFSARNVLSSQYINPDFIRDNIGNLLSQEKYAHELWRYINLELWLQVFFDNRHQDITAHK